MDLIGRSIAAAVQHNLAGPLLRRSTLTKQIPRVPLGKLLRNPHLREGNVPALFADLTKEFGPVFEVRPPFKEPMIFLAGTETNRWVHRHGRLHLRVREYFADFEKIYGAVGVLPSLDGADHFRLRKALSPAYSRTRLAGQLYGYVRKYMADWKVGDVYPASRLCRRMINAQISPLAVSVDSQDIIDDLIKYKERALTTHIIGALPKFLLKTPGMKRRAKAVETLLGRLLCPRLPNVARGCIDSAIMAAGPLLRGEWIRSRPYPVFRAEALDRTADNSGGISQWDHPHDRAWGEVDTAFVPRLSHLA